MGLRLVAALQTWGLPLFRPPHPLCRRGAQKAPVPLQTRRSRQLLQALGSWFIGYEEIRNVRAVASFKMFSF